eukprot:COSAG04_NODE_76_length_28498_cov_7.756294_11_plen_139_part_00
MEGTAKKREKTGEKWARYGLKKVGPITDSWQTHGTACGWGDPLGTAAADFAVARKALVINLSPDTAKHPDQAAVFATFAAHLDSLGAFSGWAEPESAMVALLSTEPSIIERRPALFFLGHISPIFARVFAIFSLSSPS